MQPLFRHVKSYSRDLSSTFVLFALLHMFYTNTLDILTAACSIARSHASLPWWCPDWSQPTPQCDTQYTIGTYCNPPFHAGPVGPEINVGRTKVGMFQDQANGPLIIEGSQNDTVEAIAPGDFNVRTYHDPSSSSNTRRQRPSTESAKVALF